jgi:hypothetical protein
MILQATSKRFVLWHLKNPVVRGRVVLSSCAGRSRTYFYAQVDYVYCSQKRCWSSTYVQYDRDLNAQPHKIRGSNPRQSWLNTRILYLYLIV